MSLTKEEVEIARELGIPLDALKQSKANRVTMGYSLLGPTNKGTAAETSSDFVVRPVASGATTLGFQTGRDFAQAIMPGSSKTVALATDYEPADSPREVARQKRLARLQKMKAEGRAIDLGDDS